MRTCVQLALYQSLDGVSGKPKAECFPYKFYRSIVMEVKEAPEGVKGDSANNVQKAVTLVTGKIVQAPLFIKTGDKLIIDSRTGKYMGRA